MNPEIARTLAKYLLEIEAVKLRPEQPFTWASGWKSPIYCDNRLTLSYPRIRTYIKNALYEMILEAFPGVEAIAGVATAGIPQGALVADMMGLPFFYIRSKPKEHGMGNMIEGKVEKGQKVVVVEDLISTGKSSLQAAEALQEAEAEVMGMAAIFTYGFETADKAFALKNIPLATLTNYEILAEEAVNNGYIIPELLGSLQDWRKSPDTWGK
jgi:orotate phosphoribosyltransferase